MKSWEIAREFIEQGREEERANTRAESQRADKAEQRANTAEQRANIAEQRVRELEALLAAQAQS